MDADDILGGVPFLAAASRAGRAALASAARTERLSRGDFLFHADSPVRRVWILGEGRATTERTSPHGTPLVFHVAGPGETPGGSDLLHEGGTHVASSRALSPVTALSVPAHVCLALLESEPAVLLAYARDLGGIIRVLNGAMADLVFLDLERRLGSLLAATPADGAGRLDLGMTQGELAAHLGVARQSLNQALSRLAARGLVAVAGSDVTLTDRTGLAEFVASPPPRRAGRR